MLRELAEALEVLTADRLLVLVLEDLHRSDRATLEWLAYVGRRRDPARLLILGTYRPVEVDRHAHPLRALLAEFQQHPQYAELVLDYLSEAAVVAYLQHRFGATSTPPALPHICTSVPAAIRCFWWRWWMNWYASTSWRPRAWPGGNRGLWRRFKSWSPPACDSILSNMSSACLARIKPCSRLPVWPDTFAVAAVAAAVPLAPEALEGRYTALARHGQFIAASGTETWPDGTVTACYQFRHALYHEVVYARVGWAEVRLHQQIGARKAAGYGVQAQQIAAELAMHFERGQETQQAVVYLQQAADTAQRRAYAEVISISPQAWRCCTPCRTRPSARSVNYCRRLLSAQR